MVFPLTVVPGRAGVEPDLSLTYTSEAAGSSGVLGAGFSLSGVSSITRCGSDLAQDGEIRGVRHDAKDKLCFSGQRLVVLNDQPGQLEFRTFPDSFAKVVGHYASEADKPGNASSFQVFLPSGLVIDLGTSEAGKPLAKGGVARAWLAEKVHDGRGNAMTFDYCFADDPAEGYTAEYALDEIRYTGFEGSPALLPSRAVKLVYGTKHPADVRTLYASGMALQNSLRLEEIKMLGPGDHLVRRYGFAYDLGPSTHRTLLKQVEECAADGVCKPPTRFQYQGSEPGFEKIPTEIPAPISGLGSPMLVDIDGDGLDDLVSPDIDPVLSTPGQPITRWLVAHNGGPGAAPAFFAPPKLGFSEEWPIVANPPSPSDPAHLQPEVGTALDYDDDRRTDILLHDVYDSRHNWQVLMAGESDTFEVLDTGIARPFPLGHNAKPPALTTEGASTHLADLDGDGKPDLVQCDDHGAVQSGDPSAPAWSVHLWQAKHDATPAGFDSTGAPIDFLAGYRCNTELYTIDVDGDGKVDLLVGNGGPEIPPTATYLALSRLHDGSFQAVDTELPLIFKEYGRVVFLDVNGDGLPDAVEGGFSNGVLQVFFNNGRRFAGFPLQALKPTGLSAQDTYFDLAVPIDFNGDGRQDLLMPIAEGFEHTETEVLPSWAVFLATGESDDINAPAFRLVDPHIPFEAEIDQAISLADPHGARTGDVDGDGAQDVVLPIGGFFTVFRNRAADQDLLVAVSDGMNAHDPEDTAFVPNVHISYGHLTDGSITDGIADGDPARESYSYLARSDAAHDCAYPLRCAVGPRRIVTAYETNNGADGRRRFALRYRDGRFDRLGRGFLGFGERILTDLDTGAGVADFYDNETFDADLHTFPFAGQIQREWRWYPGLPQQPEPERIELSFTDLTYTVVPTGEQVTYFTLPTHRRVRRAQGAVNGAVEPYVAKVEASGGATLLRDVTVTVNDFDLFGQIRSEDVTIAGLDLTFHAERDFKNDTDRWVLGQLQSQKECSAAAGISQCRTLTRTTTIFGEVESESAESDDGSPDTQLSTVYGRDAFGNIKGITSDDAFGHHRASSATYEPEGIYPQTHTNAAGHVSLTEYDAALGVLIQETDPNLLVTTWAYDGFGRLALEKRPDGGQTAISLTRSKDGGAYRVMQRSTTTGGADDTVELDGQSRAIRMWWHGPEPLDAPGGTPRLMQEIVFDDLGEHVARRSLPVREDTPEGALLFDEYAYDGLGREIEHAAPWGLHVSTSYLGAQVTVSDSLGKTTVADQDVLGRPVAVHDAAKGITSYTYGPFGLLRTVTDPGGALTVTTRDAFGRVRELDDPDRGTTLSVHDGFGELVSSTDALGRAISYEYDVLGRPLSRLDQVDGKPRATAWTWDLAAHGLGKLQALTSPDGAKSYTYNAKGKPETLSLAVEGEIFTGRLDYDASGRISAVTYPTPSGALPFVVAQDYDAHGHLLTARDSTTSFPYWQLAEVDEAGRVQKEVLGKIVTTERSYFADKQSLKSIHTTHGGAIVQELSYAYDSRRNLASRTDALQGQHPTERFRYDDLDRLTCAYFGQVENPAAPCALGYGYDPNGNLTFKSDVGPLLYDDPAHPHAVTGAGADSFGYDAVGNQIARPGNMTVTYTAFDLPATVTQGANAFSFGYDGDEKRIRKTTPEEETLYFSDLYERVSSVNAPVEHRYYVRSPERVVAVVTRGGDQPGTRYLHVDNLGSTDAVTDESGNVVEHRSYDPFGQRRNPDWGKPPPAVFSSLTSVGFTGHESDGELGLVNAKGRMYDPKIGRFLTMDPVVQAPLSGQSWNPYSYVINNPLTYVDPSGFEYAPGEEPQRDQSFLNDRAAQAIIAQGCMGLECLKPAAPKPEAKAGGEEVGAAVPPVDVSTMGSSSGLVTQPATAAPEDWKESPLAQLAGGFLGGLCLGGVPFAGAGQQLLEAAGVTERRNQDARVGLALGQMVGGLLATGAGLAGDVGGGALSLSGFGAVIGVPVIAGSTVVAAGGVANVLAGVAALATTGSGSGPVHHVMTNKNDTSTDRGGPWTPRFEAMAKRAGMTLEDAANKVEVPGHQGPHPQAYHQAVFERLSRATDGLSGDAYSRAFRAQLDAIRTEAATVGTTLNSLLTKQ